MAAGRSAARLPAAYRDQVIGQNRFRRSAPPGRPGTERGQAGRPGTERGTAGRAGGAAGAGGEGGDGARAVTAGPGVPYRVAISRAVAVSGPGGGTNTASR